MELNDDCSTGDEPFVVCCDVDPWPPKDEMAGSLRAGGLGVSVGRYSIRIIDFEQFVFQEYGGDLGDPQLDAYFYEPEEASQQVGIVSQLLTSISRRHRFEIYAPDNQMRAYFHHAWPSPSI